MTNHQLTYPTLSLFGGSRGIGQAFLHQAVQGGHAVRVLVRDPSRLQASLESMTQAARSRVQLVAGDVLDPSAVRETMRGSHAAVCALGAPARDRSRIRSRGTTRILEAMEEAGLDRLVAVTVFGAGESRTQLPFWIRYLLFPLFLREAIADHEEQEAILKRSTCRWTAVRPPNLTDGPATGDYARGFSESSNLTMTISRADVAAFMLHVLEKDAFIRAAPGISYRKARRRDHPVPQSSRS
ncbi:MAG: NAD(P)-dependent oxidoreductase [Myxococcota bacterium]